jgi:DNA-binding MarR family transcriptional regulator
MGSQASSTDRGSEDVREVLNAVRRLVRALRLGNREAEHRVGLSGARLFVLQVIGADGELSLGEIAALTSTDPSSVSVVVGRLVEQGLVSRRRSARDSRRLEIALTARGRSLLRRAPGGVVQHRLVRAVRELAPSERRRLGALLARVVAAMGYAERGAPHMFFEDHQRSAKRAGGRPRG